MAAENSYLSVSFLIRFSAVSPVQMCPCLPLANLSSLCRAGELHNHARAWSYLVSPAAADLSAEVLYWISNCVDVFKYFTRHEPHWLAQHPNGVVLYEACPGSASWRAFHAFGPWRTVDDGLHFHVYRLQCPQTSMSKNIFSVRFPLGPRCNCRMSFISSKVAQAIFCGFLSVRGVIWLVLSGLFWAWGLVWAWGWFWVWVVSLLDGW